MELNRHADSESETLFSDGLSQSPGSQGSSSSPDIPASTQSPRLTSSIQKAYYNMKHKKSGRVIIFLHENFEQRLKVKRVTHINTNDLKEYFKKIGFDQCDIKIDLSDSEIHQVLNEAAAEDHTDRDCIVVVVLTHGSRGYLYSKNSYYKPEDLWAPFAADKCQSLADKPKLFFIQASEDAVTNNPDGCKMMTDGSHSNYLPVQSDFLIAYSTAPGCLWGFLKETLSNMFNDNNDLLTSLSIAKPVQQNPTITHTLRRLVKFRKKNHLLESVIMNDSPELGGERLLRTEELVRCESSLLSTLFKLPDENFASTSQYICRFLDLIQKMNDKGELVEDRVMLTALLYGLPKSMPNREKFKGYITRKYPDNAQFQKVLEELRVVSEKEFSDPNQSGYNQSTPLETEKHLADDRADNSDDVTVDDPILQHISEDHKYKMETMENCPIGLALLIAHETFEKESKLEERPSFKKEVSKICETFTGLGFDVRQFLNKSKEEIINFLNYVGKEDHSNINCLAVIVCSHGDSGGMIHADDGMYSVYDLFKPFQAANCSTLAGKPKLFFLGPCRGMKYQTTIKLHDDVPNYDSDMETDMGGRTRIDLAYPKKKKKRVTHELPWPDIEDHFLISFSTIQDHVAFASHQDSMYIKSLYKRLTAQRDIQHILTFANYESALISTPKHAQISQVTSKLRKILVFPSNVKEGGITGYL